MEHRALGRTGIDVSVLGLGTVKLGRNSGVKYPEAFDLPSDADAMALLDACCEAGVNLLDTAPAYGTSEERLGGLLRERGDRDSWVLSTKVGERFDSALGRSSFDFSGRGVRASVERSLERLGTDWLDVVMLHSDGRDEWVLRESGGLGALLELKARGLIRAVGASTKSLDGALAAVELCDVVMVTVHAGYLEEVPAVEAASRRGVGVLVKKALASGHGIVGGAGAAFEAVLGRGWSGGVSSVVIGTSKASRVHENAEAMRVVMGNERR